MKIAITADPELPVPPEHYGGIERIVDLLVTGLVAHGHDVTLFAHPSSRTRGRLVEWPGQASQALWDSVRNAATLTAQTAHCDFDLVHSFSRLQYMLPILPSPIPKLMTYQRRISRKSVQMAHLLSGGTLEFTAISNWMMQDVQSIARWHVIPNGVSTETFEFKELVPDNAPFVFLGRIEEIKGPHLAIEIARRSGRALIIAGNVPEGHEAWFRAHVAPYVDGSLVQYVGPVNDVEKNELLGSASAFLMPILWDEPFGIVMAEAMACGTPVLGLRRGAVPEVVDDGVTGFVRDNVDALVKAADEITRIRRADCRSRVEYLYSSEAVVNGYLQAYASHGCIN